MKKLEQRIAEFASHMNQGLESLNKACKVYAATIREMPEAIKAFHDKFEFITETTWDKMRLVGDGLMDVKILLLTDRQGHKIALDKTQKCLRIPGTKSPDSKICY